MKWGAGNRHLRPTKCPMNSHTSARPSTETLRGRRKPPISSISPCPPHPPLCLEQPLAHFLCTPPPSVCCLSSFVYARSPTLCTPASCGPEAQICGILCVWVIFSVYGLFFLCMGWCTERTQNLGKDAYHFCVRLSRTQFVVLRTQPLPCVRAATQIFP